MLKTSQPEPYFFALLSRIRWSVWLIVCGLLFFASGAVAQPCTIHLNNGDRVQGQLLNLVDGVLDVETTWAGVLSITFDEVEKLETSEPVTLESASGETSSGLLRLQATGEVEIIADSGSSQRLDRTDLVAINPPAPKPLYTGSFSVGANIQSGNSDQRNFSVAGNLKRETEKNTFNFSLRWVDAEQNDERTARSTFAAFKYDRTLSEKFYGYGSLELLEDEFKDLDLRTVASVGAGYKPFDTDRRSLALEGGVSYFSRDYFSIPDEDEITIRLASYLTWTLAEGVVLRETLAVYPSFEDDSSLNFRHEFSLTTLLFAGWAAEFASILDYDEDPPPGIDEEDWLWVLGLNYSF